MNRRLKLILLLLLVFAIVWWYRGGGDRAPDEKLAGNFTAICQIAKTNVESPRAGVGKLFHYLGRKSPEMMEQLGATLVAIERISDDRAHDKRARLAARRIQTPLKRCESTFERFFEAVHGDPEALAMMERGLERFSRTLEIILSSSGTDALRRQLASFSR